MKIKVMAEYCSSGLWDIEHGGMIGLDKLKVSKELSELIKEWIDLYSSRINWDDPSIETVISKSMVEKFNKIEKRVFRLIHNELSKEHSLKFISSRLK